MQKIFGIGFHKTGTKSLAQALSILGYRVTGPNGVHDPEIAQKVYQITDDLVAQFDAFQDNPWPNLFKELDEKYPGSKFILTLRDRNVWIKSVVGHFGKVDTPMREWIYGAGFGHPEGNEDVYLNRYEKHNRDVMEHFKVRPEDLLVMDYAAGDGWEKLCGFLGKDIPVRPFPHANKAEERMTEFDFKPVRKPFWKKWLGE